MLDGKRILDHRRDDQRLDRLRRRRAGAGAGAEVVLTGFGRARRLTERAARRLPEPADVLELDVNRPSDLARRARRARASAGAASTASLHAIAFAPADALGGDFLATPPESAEPAFRTAPTRSRRSPRRSLPLLPEARGALVGLDFDAAGRLAGLRLDGRLQGGARGGRRYLARDLGPQGVRVNLVSAGPLRDARRRRHPRVRRARRRWARAGPARLGRERPGARSPTPSCFLLSDGARAHHGRDPPRRRRLPRHRRAGLAPARVAGPVVTPARRPGRRARPSRGG